MEILEIKKHKKNISKFECLVCDFKCCTKSDWGRHIIRPKHVLNVSGNKMEIKKSVKSVFICYCGKKYNTNSGLWKHQSKCENVNQKENKDVSENIINLTNLICELVKTNTDIQKSVIELCKNGTTNNIINNHNINSNNKTFSLQVFLNETCKDAMNIMDFVESVKLQVTDLENVGKVGYIEGISNIIIKNLQALDIDKRPVHCTDQKREVIYVKDENTWEKEDETNKKLRKAILLIAHKNICMLKEFREKYPDCQEYDSKKNDQYNKIVYESMGGKGDNDYDKDTKIIKKIAKNVIIDKNMNNCQFSM